MTSKHTMKSRISVFMAIKDKLMGFSCGFYGIFIFKQLVVYVTPFHLWAS